MRVIFNLVVIPVDELTITCCVYMHRLIKKLLQQLFTDNILLLGMNYVTKPVSLFNLLHMVTRSGKLDILH